MIDRKILQDLAKIRQQLPKGATGIIAAKVGCTGTTVNNALRGYYTFQGKKVEYLNRDVINAAIDVIEEERMRDIQLKEKMASIS